MTSTFRTRFAPSPTGPPHLGMLRTALFAWLVARKADGRFVVRIDDTDPERSKKEFETEILESLKYLGINWDEGPDVGGRFAPYRQSERAAQYSEAIEKLKSDGFLYPCFCTESDLNILRAAARAAGKAYIYNGKCRELDEKETDKRIASGEPYVWRFHVDSERLGETVAFRDIVYGEQNFRTSLIGDFVCVRGDGKPTYMLVSPLDDAAMEITHIIRGADHIPNTPAQMLLLKALGHRAPEFAHLPLITGPGGKKLSKRDSMTGLGEIRRWLPAALINHLALLGWTHPAGTEIVSIEQLVESFDLIRVSTSPAAHDPSRLSYLERAHLVKMQPEEILAAWEKSSHGIRLDDDIAKKSRKILSVVGDEMTSLGMVAENVIRLAEGPSDDDITEGFRALDREDVADTLRAMRGTCAGSRMDVLEAIAESRGKAKVYLPIRIALTGETRGFEMSRIFGALTTAEIDKRLLRASELLEKLQ